MIEYIRQWVQAQTPTFPEPVTVHIDALLQRQIRREDVVSTACMAYEMLLSEAKHLYHRLMPTLIIPLTSAECLDILVPASTALFDNLGYEPPSLYLIDRNIFKYFSPREEYTYPTQLEYLEPRHGLSVRYVTFRNIEDIDNGWEYARMIQVDYYSDEYVL